MSRKLPELVLLDVMLPEEDGFSVLKKLRAATATAAIPVIMLTAKDTEFDRVTGLDGGADDFVSKPFGMMELMAAPCGKAAVGAAVAGWASVRLPPAAAGAGKRAGGRAHL